MNKVSQGSFKSLNPYQTFKMDGVPLCLSIKETAQLIFMHLDIQSLGNVAQVCHAWQIFSTDNFCWKACFDHTNKSLFGLLIEKADGTSYKDFIHKSRGNRIKNINQILASFDGKYGINMQEIQISTWGKNKRLPVVLAKDHMLDDVWECQKIQRNPVQFTYREAFEYIISKINYMIARENFSSNEFDQVTLSHNELTLSITNLEHFNVVAIKELNIPKPVFSDYISWFNVILAVLKKEEVIKNYHDEGLKIIIYF